MKFLLCIFTILNLYVSPQGHDDNDGSQANPVKSFQRAQTLARAAKCHVNVWFAPGIYYLPATVVLTDADSHVSFHSQEPQGAVLSGGERLSLKWKRGKDGVYWARLEGYEGIDQLFVNGVRRRMARYPNPSGIQDANIFDCWKLGAQNDSPQEDALSPERIARWKDPRGGYVHAMHNLLWGDMHWRITGRDSTGLLMEGGWQNNRPSKMHDTYRFVENIREELDEPGEWYYDAKQSKLYYMPGHEDLINAVIEAVRLDCLVAFRGTQEVAVRGITLDGFVFRHVGRTFMENREPLLRSDWTVCRKGAVTFENAEDCRIENCDFDQVGGNAVVVSRYNKDITVRSCLIEEAGSSGVVFVGDPGSVRNPLFDYSQRGSEATDLEQGPRTRNYPSRCLVEDCLIMRTGRTEKQTAGVQISMSQGIRVNHCTVCNVPRAGINISEGTFGGHVIENCDVFNTVLETGDHGSFNSWGRDRYWNPSVQETAKNVADHPGREMLDMMAPNTLCHNRWRCDHGWDVDLDDGSSNYLICHNLLLNGGLKLREGYHRRVINNIIVGNSMHMHVWYPNSDDVITRNIFDGEYAPIGMPEDSRWGACIDHNLFASPNTVPAKHLASGCDSCSVFANPLFIDSAHGDYRVQDDSPALALGFENFSMDDFGVVSARLKAIAPSPILPDAVASLAQGAAKSETINGVRWTFVTGDGMSAYGMPFDATGFSVNWKGECPLPVKGLRQGDLVMKINNVVPKDFSALKKLLQDGIKNVEVAREQKIIKL